MKYARTALVAMTIATLPATALAENGFYLGGSVGSASLTEDFDGFEVDADSTAWRLVAGWQFSEFLSLEGGYHNFGRFEDSFALDGQPVDLRLKADGFTLGGTLSLPLTRTLSLYGRGGAFFWDGDADVNSITEARPEDTNPYYGAGAKVALTERLDLIGDWTRYELDSTDSDVISLGLTIRF